VQSITLNHIRVGGPGEVKKRLLNLDGSVCIVNAVEEKDLEVVALALLQVEETGESFIFRTAASNVPVIVGMESKPLLAPKTLPLTGSNGSLIVVASYVPNSTSHLNHLLKNTDTASLEIPLIKLLDDTDSRLLFKNLATRIDQYKKTSLIVIKDLISENQLLNGSSARLR